MTQNSYLADANRKLVERLHQSAQLHPLSPSKRDNLRLALKEGYEREALRMKYEEEVTADFNEMLKGGDKPAFNRHVAGVLTRINDNRSLTEVNKYNKIENQRELTVAERQKLNGLYVKTPSLIKLRAQQVVLGRLFGSDENKGTFLDTRHLRSDVLADQATALVFQANSACMKQLEQALTPFVQRQKRIFKHLAGLNSFDQTTKDSDGRPIVAATPAPLASTPYTSKEKRYQGFPIPEFRNSSFPFHRKYLSEFDYIDPINPNAQFTKQIGWKDFPGNPGSPTNRFKSATELAEAVLKYYGLGTKITFDAKRAQGFYGSKTSDGEIVLCTAALDGLNKFIKGSRSHEALAAFNGLTHEAAHAEAEQYGKKVNRQNMGWMEEGMAATLGAEKLAQLTGYKTDQPGYPGFCGALDKLGSMFGKRAVLEIWKNSPDPEKAVEDLLRKYHLQAPTDRKPLTANGLRLAETIIAQQNNPPRPWWKFWA